MKSELVAALQKAVHALQKTGILPADLSQEIHIERTRDLKHGDFACNFPLIAAKATQQNPRDLAECIVAHLPKIPNVKQVEIAGPGFINFTLSEIAYANVLQDIFTQGDHYGHSREGRGSRIHIEFVSANPTGPLHVGHGRAAAYGAVLADLLEAVGFKVHREYYVNDAGRQMDILAVSVWLRYLALAGETFPFPTNAYRGEYVIEIARTLYEQHPKTFVFPAKTVFEDVPEDEGQPNGDKEAHIDGVIVRAKILLSEHYRTVFDLALQTILKDIREDLAEFGVHFQEWFSEQSLFTSGAVEKAIEQLKKTEYVFEREGAWWFRSTDFGDDKDRVILRANGQPTYFASDIANYLGKYARGADRLIVVLGADHHGYAPRIKAALAALGKDPNTLTIPIVQFAILYRGKERVQMSTRSGSFVTLRELRDEVGNDAARFFYVWRKCEQHMDFDLDLAKSQSNENPLYYIQYAHARICSVMRQLAEKKETWDQRNGSENISKLSLPVEKNLMVALARYPEVILSAALTYEPHTVAHFLRELANEFHVYYNQAPFLVEETSLRNARLYLINATRQILRNGLRLLGVSAPESM